MKRRYTRKDYLRRVTELRQACPDIAITTDFIVGFPGESETEFEATLSLAYEVQFDGLFAFKYSDREQAPASAFEDKLPERVKQRRLLKLLTYQDQVNISKNRALIGSIQEIMVDGFSKKVSNREDRDQWSGRTSTNRIVNFQVGAHDPDNWRPIAGQILQVNIEKAFHHSLWGTPILKQSRPSQMKGAFCHAV
jgi:tRNA-2-methylthio-N6-dimethylallyladenosine synthase